MKGFSIQLIGKGAKGRPKLRMGERGYKALYRSEHHHFRMSVEGPGNIRKALLSAFSHFSSYKIPTLHIKTFPHTTGTHIRALTLLSMMCRTFPPLSLYTCHPSPWDVASAHAGIPDHCLRKSKL